MDSPIEHKNTYDAVRYCIAKEEEYELMTMELQAKLEKMTVAFNQMVKTGYVGGSKI